MILKTEKVLKVKLKMEFSTKFFQILGKIWNSTLEKEIEKCQYYLKTYPFLTSDFGCNNLIEKLFILDALKDLVRFFLKLTTFGVLKFVEFHWHQFPS